MGDLGNAAVCQGKHFLCGRDPLIRQAAGKGLPGFLAEQSAEMITADACCIGNIIDPDILCQVCTDILPGFFYMDIVRVLLQGGADFLTELICGIPDDPGQFGMIRAYGDLLKQPVCDPVRVIRENAAEDCGNHECVDQGDSHILSFLAFVCSDFTLIFFRPQTDIQCFHELFRLTVLNHPEIRQDIMVGSVIFGISDDLMNCWHISKNVFPELERFYEAEAEEDDLLFLMFAHGYEFDFNTVESNWNKLERICRSVAEHSDIICCSTADAFRMHEGENV